MKRLFHKGLQATKELFAVVCPLVAWLWDVAEILRNQEQWKADIVQNHFEATLERMRTAAKQADTGRPALVHFLKVTQSYAPHLFFCYQIADLPKTNNDLEQAFGKVRASERRATGRRGAIPGLVVRGPVRLTTTLAARLHLFSDEELIPDDLTRWRQLRCEVSSRQEIRRKQSRFHKDPHAYLVALEQRLSKMSLRF
ncbi:hypothetical protein KSX_94390 [Ktedonospora formicarum]|uniref:Transposase n=1 Tax=Ktedonospora formicarum TaxID=2778364 RepID=A0A8J3I9T9_9CHLR|nr:hypothetical protein KSX_94390 [Ktedonospora formicarum]